MKKKDKRKKKSLLSFPTKFFLKRIAMLDFENQTSEDFVFYFLDKIREEKLNYPFQD